MKKVFSIIICICFVLFISISLAETVTKQEIIVHFTDVDRTGLYSGEINEKGNAEGFGVFEAVNKEGYRYIVVGEWVDGHQTGEAWKVWENGDINIGLFEDGHFVAGKYARDVTFKEYDERPKVTGAEGQAYPMGNSNWYMVEFLEWGNITEPADIMIYWLAKMRLAGINTILAHPERYKAIQQDWNLAKRICDLGVLLQVNAYDLCQNKNLATRNLAQWMAQEHLISFIGSDMHGTRIKEDGKPARKPQMKDGVRWLYENVDEEYANDIVRRNAEKYLGVTKLPVEQNREYILYTNSERCQRTFSC